MRARRPLPAVVLGLAALTAAGCAHIPAGGPVHLGAAVTGAPAPRVHVAARGPVDGERKEDLVRGFLQALADPSGDYRVAREYLSPELAPQWKPSAGVLVYSDLATPLVQTTTANALDVVLREVGTVDAAGAFTVVPAKDTRVAVSVRSTGGNWRITDVPEGLFLPESTFHADFTSMPVYFFDPDQTVLVPEPRWVTSDEAGSSTALVKALLAGPTAAGAAGLVTAFPKSTALTVESVPVGSDGVAAVELSKAALSSNAAERRAMAAQLVWTLGGLPDVQGVSISAQGVAIPENTHVQVPSMYATVDPGVVSPSVLPVMVRQGVYGVLRGEAFVPAPDTFGKGRLVSAPAGAVTGGGVAALSRDRRQLFVAGLGALRTVKLAAHQLGNPGWDRSGNIWVLDRVGPKASTLWEVSGSTAVASVVPLPSFDDAHVVEARISRDGTRAALVTQTPGGDTSLWVATVVRGAPRRTPTRLVDPQLLAPSLVELSDVSWQDADHLLVIGSGAGGGRLPYVVGLDGSDPQPGPSLLNILSVTGGPNSQPLLAAAGSGDDRSIIYEQVGSRFQPLFDGSQPSVP